MKVVHLITGLETGGAELMLFRLVTHHDRARVRPMVISLSGRGVVGSMLESHGIEVRAMGLSLGAPASAARLVAELRQAKPDIVQTWLYHANVLGGGAGRLAGAQVVWGLHNVQLTRMRRLTGWMARAGALCSASLPARIICCGEAVRDAHIAMGYAAQRMTVIPNGFDCEAFAPSDAARLAVRQELGLAADAVLIGLVGRYDPAKDHGNFARAAGLLVLEHPGVRFVLCGEGVDEHNEELRWQLAAADVLGRCHLLGRREDIPRLQAAFDIACSSSSSEGLPLAIGEAMASGVTCAVTDVGDTAVLVADTGRVVPARSPEALARALGELIAIGPSGRQRLGAAARRRIEQRFGVASVTARYEELYESLKTKPNGFSRGHGDGTDI